MSKHVSRVRGETRDSRRAGSSGRTVSSVPTNRVGREAERSADAVPADTASVHDRLARLLDTPLLARVVPQLTPETLHQLIRHRGLDACGELVASATPEQLTSVLDLDLWPSTRPGRDERFDEDRFGEWLEMLVDAGAAVAARTVAAIDENLVIAGLSRYIRVLDPGAVTSSASTGEESIDAGATRFDGFECEVGGYVVRARRTGPWDALVALLIALDAGHRDYFHSAMQGCRRLSDSTPEIDGLDNLLLEPEQQMHDAALERERRRSQQGCATPADARAFLQMARQRRRERPVAKPSTNPLAAAYFRAADEAAASSDRNARPQEHSQEPSTHACVPESIDAVVDLLTEAGLMSARPRALLDAAAPPRLMRMRTLLAHLHDTDHAAFLRRTRELAFLANTLMAGCSIQSRAFTAQEAWDAAVGICNLGLECWPARWLEAEMHDAASTADKCTPLPDTFLAHHDLVVAFEVGWAVLHEEVGMFVAEQLIATLADLRCVDAEIQSGLNALRRELVRQHDAGTPWRARAALDVLAMLDVPAWHCVLGLLDECPVVPAALTAISRSHRCCQCDGVRVHLHDRPDSRGASLHGEASRHSAPLTSGVR